MRVVASRSSRYGERVGLCPEEALHLRVAEPRTVLVDDTVRETHVSPDEFLGRYGSIPCEGANLGILDARPMGRQPKQKRPRAGKGIGIISWERCGDA